ncbi:MAG: cytochrome o ubiquinol oxidase subunit IV [Castellaniella sp.]|uniref:cytochrome o ubiquinol oxidase subunit IV n=1 Tax=Castellaniella sp. TaxID=1955812 RepID=UPI0011FAAEFC|nr:cytochrome o ubiquinol oxidase subunit IV [Castellaniella sp.]TAN28027.1 MAG: cytochrome o ubiquinol oxidase subunit IV [Castellaniella sp.]
MSPETRQQPEDAPESIHAHPGTLRGYLTGFGLAAILTIIPFALVMGHAVQNRFLLIFLVLALGAAQIVIHIVYFLHLDTRSEGGWNMLAFIFTVVLVVIVLGASIWVMYEENANMMATPSTAMRSTLPGS